MQSELSGQTEGRKFACRLHSSTRKSSMWTRSEAYRGWRPCGGRSRCDSGLAAELCGLRCPRWWRCRPCSPTPAESRRDSERRCSPVRCWQQWGLFWTGTVWIWLTWSDRLPAHPRIVLQLRQQFKLAPLVSGGSGRGALPHLPG